MGLIINIVNYLFRIYNYFILARILLSWIPVDDSSPIIRFIYRITEPLLAPFRIVISLGNTGIDLAPIIVFFLLNILRTSLIKLIINLYYH